MKNSAGPEYWAALVQSGSPGYNAGATEYTGRQGSMQGLQNTQVGRGYKIHIQYRQGCNQRIYIYKEYKATSPRLYTGAFYARKQEAVRKTTPELLSAVLRSLLCGCVCVLYFTSILCTLYSRVGQFFRF